MAGAPAPQQRTRAPASRPSPSPPPPPARGRRPSSPPEAPARPFQLAVAAGLAADVDFFARFVADYRSRRERLCAGLAAAGYGVLPPQGTYFVVAEIWPLGFEDDLPFCRALPASRGVAAIPVSAFREEPARVRHLVRFAFCKRDETLDEGARRLRERLRR